MESPMNLGPIALLEYYLWDADTLLFSFEFVNAQDMYHIERALKKILDTLYEDPSLQVSHQFVCEFQKAYDEYVRYGGHALDIGIVQARSMGKPNDN
jgi:hypothetical protein